jgi:hypothetical protein
MGDVKTDNRMLARMLLDYEYKKWKAKKRPKKSKIIALNKKV